MGSSGTRDFENSVNNATGRQSKWNPDANTFQKRMFDLEAAGPPPVNAAAEAAAPAASIDHDAPIGPKKATIWDKAIQHKMPQIAAGGLATAWLVNTMCSSRGQQSNSQLYGQQ